MGLEDVLAFNAWDIGVLLNSASDSDGNVTTTPGKLDWEAPAVTDGIGLPDFRRWKRRGPVDLGSGGAELPRGWRCSRAARWTCGSAR